MTYNIETAVYTRKETRAMINILTNKVLVLSPKILFYVRPVL